MTFDEAFDELMRHEGGYVNDPRDPGGETRYGISRRAYPDEDIAGLTLERARALYRRDYWDRCQCGALPAWIAGQVFDAAVNSGPHQAALWLQRAVGAQPDGVIGPRTIGVVRRADPGTAVARFNAHRLAAMTGMKNWQAHGRGWARRIAAKLLEV